MIVKLRARRSDETRTKTYSPPTRRVRVGDSNAMHPLAVALDKAVSLPVPLRTALTFACDSERPVHSVKQLAQAVMSNRRTLWHQWRKVVGLSGLRLQDFLHWVLLLRATGLKSSGHTWQSAAKEVGIHPHTLSRYAKQLTGQFLLELGAAGEEPVLRLFHDRVLRFLLAG